MGTIVRSLEAPPGPEAVALGLSTQDVQTAVGSMALPPLRKYPTRQGPGAEPGCRESPNLLLEPLAGWNGDDLLWRKRIHTRTDDTGEGGRDDRVEGEKTGQWEQLELSTSSGKRQNQVQRHSSHLMLGTIQREKPLLVVSRSRTRSSLLEQTKAT